MTAETDFHLQEVAAAIGLDAASIKQLHKAEQDSLVNNTWCAKIDKSKLPSNIQNLNDEKIRRWLVSRLVAYFNSRSFRPE